MGQRRLQARDTDRKTRRRHRLAAEARYEPIITATAANRAEAHWPTFLIVDLEGELNFIDGTGVVLEAADDGFFDTNTIIISGCLHQSGNFRKLLFACARWCHATRHVTFPCDHSDDAGYLRICKLSAFCEVAAVVLAPLAKQHFDAIDAEAIELIDSAHRGEVFLRRNSEGV